jgi:hypothetical protein
MSRAGLSPWWVGALVGGAVGCLSRPAVIAAFWLSGNDVSPDKQANVPIVLCVSLVIGGFVGGITGGLGGLTRMPILGSILGGFLGGFLAGSATFVTCLPLLLTVGHGSRGGDIDDPSLYVTAMILTGVVPGALGGLAGGLWHRKRVKAGMGQAETPD